MATQTTAWFYLRGRGQNARVVLASAGKRVERRKPPKVITCNNSPAKGGMGRHDVCCSRGVKESFIPDDGRDATC